MASAARPRKEEGREGEQNIGSVQGGSKRDGKYDVTKWFIFLNRNVCLVTLKSQRICLDYLRLFEK